jgi:hypothetical protein
MEFTELKKKYKLSAAFAAQTTYDGFSPAGALKCECMAIDDVRVFALIVSLETCMDFASPATRLEIQAKLDTIAKMHDIKL